MMKIVDQVRDCDTVASISAALAKVKIFSETFQSFPLFCIIFVNLPNNPSIGELTHTIKYSGKWSWGWCSSTFLSIRIRSAFVQRCLSSQPYFCNSSKCLHNIHAQCSLSLSQLQNFRRIGGTVRGGNTPTSYSSQVWHLQHFASTWTTTRITDNVSIHKSYQHDFILNLGPFPALVIFFLSLLISTSF